MSSRGLHVRDAFCEIPVIQDAATIRSHHDILATDIAMKNAAYLKCILMA
jgi:hypothetical protein